MTETDKIKPKTSNEEEMKPKTTNKEDVNPKTFNKEDVKPKATEKEVKPSEDVKDKISTCPFDPRFPHMNQNYRCFISFVEFHKCTRLLGDEQECNVFKKTYKSMCPNFWIEKWEEQLETGNFPVRLPLTKEEHSKQLQSKQKAKEIDTPTTSVEQKDSKKLSVESKDGGH